MFATNIFKRQRAGPDRDNNRFQDRAGFVIEFERKSLPGPGAMNYAYMSLALPPQSPISGAVAQRAQLRPTATPMYKYQTGLVIGVPTVSGQMIMQPLFDPDAGYTAPSNVAPGFPVLV